MVANSASRRCCDGGVACVDTGPFIVLERVGPDADAPGAGEGDGEANNRRVEENRREGSSRRLEEN